MADHYHAVVWIDHKQARIFHFNVEEADKTLVKDHVVRDIHPREKRTGQRVEENKPFFEDVAKAIKVMGLTPKITEAILSSARDYRKEFEELPAGINATFERSL